MRNEIIKIRESDLRLIISETVKNVLDEINTTDNEAPDITKIDINILRSAYRDLRLTPTSTDYDNILSEMHQLKEVFGDILEPDEALYNILKKYNLPQELGKKVEHHHQISVYIIVAVVGENDKLIEQDMMKMGYFLSIKDKPVNIGGMVFQRLQFEPTSQMQDDVTEEIKEKYNVLYHWTPLYNLDSIKENGLVPSNKNDRFLYPPRTYLMTFEGNDKQMSGMGQSICWANNNPNNNGEYALLSINIKELDDNVRFYYDPNSVIGLYTEQTIPNDKIKFVQTVQFVTSLTDNN